MAETGEKEFLFIIIISFSRSLLQLMWKFEWNQKCVVSLWQWSHKLEQRVIAAWVRYTQCTRRKAERYGAAMQRHRDWLLTAGVRQWMKVREGSGGEGGGMMELVS